MSIEIQQVLEQVVEPIYQEVAAAQGRPTWRTMPFSHQCDPLSRNLFEAFANRRMTARRELHTIPTPDGPMWHFMVAHADPGDEPALSDLVTDLNPWQFREPTPTLSYIHATREELMSTLAEQGAPEWFVSLRGIQTIKERHTLSSQPN